MTIVNDWHCSRRWGARWIGRMSVIPCVVALLLLTVDAAASELASAGEWVDAAGQVVPEERVIDRLREADIALLGEVHDASAIHRKQLELLRRLDRPIVLAMEQLDRDAIDSVTAVNEPKGSLSARDRARRAGFDFEGWGWEEYGALFEMATDQGWPLWPINLSRERGFALAQAGKSGWRQQLAATDLAAIERFSPDLKLPDERQQLMADLRDAHCGQLPAAHARGMARAQIARDVLMAAALSDARIEYPAREVIAVLGNQHARKDRGAGYWLEGADHIEPARVVSVGMLPIDSFDDLSVAAGRYDFVWLTESIERDSPCEGG